MSNHTTLHEDPTLHLAGYIELEYTLRDGTIEYQYVPLMLINPLDMLKLRKAEAITPEERRNRMNARLQAKQAQTTSTAELIHLDD